MRPLGTASELPACVARPAVPRPRPVAHRRARAPVHRPVLRGRVPLDGQDHARARRPARRRGVLTLGHVRGRAGEPRHRRVHPHGRRGTRLARRSPLGAGAQPDRRLRRSHREDLSGLRAARVPVPAPARRRARRDLVRGGVRRLHGDHARRHPGHRAGRAAGAAPLVRGADPPGRDLPPRRPRPVAGWAAHQAAPGHRPRRRGGNDHLAPRPSAAAAAGRAGGLRHQARVLPRFADLPRDLRGRRTTSTTGSSSPSSRCRSCSTGRRRSRASPADASPRSRSWRSLPSCGSGPYRNRSGWATRS